MSEAARGAIKYLERYKQLISYEGMERHRHITPTDIDGVIDYAGNAFLYLECKHESVYFEKGLDQGQKTAIENLVESHRMAGHISVAFVFTHDCNSEDIIMARDQIVREIYFNHLWKSPKDPNWTVIQAVEWFEQYCKKFIYI